MKDKRVNIQTKLRPSTLTKLLSYYVSRNIVVGTKSQLVSLALDEYVSSLDKQGLLMPLSLGEERSLLTNAGFSNPVVLEELEEQERHVSSESLQAALDKLKELKNGK
jgi:hypothetical protein